MAAKIQFRRSLAATLELYPPEGRPDSNASLTVYDGQAVWGQGTWPSTIVLGSYSQSLTASADRGALEIAVSTVGLVRGRRYVLTNAFGQREEVTIDGSADASIAKLVDPLRYDHTTGSTLEDHRLVQTLTAGDLATRRKSLRALWTYTVDSVVYTETQFFDIVLQPFSIKITEGDLDELGGDILTGGMPSEKLAAYIAGAHRKMMKWLEGKRIEPDTVRNPDDLRDCVAHLVLEAISMKQIPTGPDGRNRQAEYHRRESKDLFGIFLASEAWVDVNDDLVDSRGGTGGMYYGTTWVPNSSSNQLDELGGGDEIPPASYAKVG
jgi:hypothetical protein